MNKLLGTLTLGFLLSLTLISTVNGSTSIEQNFALCNLGNWNRASNPGDVQINICNAYTTWQASVQYEIKARDFATSVASGGCNGGPCSNPTVGGISPGSYLILRIYPSYISGLQVFEPDHYGHMQQAWFPYSQFSYQNLLNCNPYYQVCYSPSQYCYNSLGTSCSVLIFRIAATPFTANVFFSLPY
jgi:hypothetical protein